MDIKKIVSEMTLEEKASLCSGLNFWNTKPIERLGVPSIMMTDGPHGLRKQKAGADHLGIMESEPATCFPAACATACSFDTALLKEMGAAMGDECAAEDVSIILGPGTNIKRSPLCGRNFEYFSEDPYLAGKMVSAHINGVQSKGVGASLKHFAVNSQETLRMTIDAVVDERTFREMYLVPFEMAVKEAAPATVMCSYNRINGEYASENEYLLTKILRDEWKFEGFTVSDWGAVSDRVKGLANGLDLEMPASGGVNDALIVQAVKDGNLDEAKLDLAAQRLIKVILETEITPDKKGRLDMDANAELARRVAGESAVLLKNDGDMFPLDKQTKVAFIGEFFERQRYQGGGSSHINPYRLTQAKDLTDDFPNASYAKGFNIDSDDRDPALLSEAVALAESSDVCVIFAGLPDRIESEGYDRKHLRLPENQIETIREICLSNGNVAVVLYNGSSIEMPWVCGVRAILEMYLGGQAAGAAAMDIITGRVNPSGKLAETFPLRLEDNPSYLYFPGDGVKTEYREGIFVGYRYYDKKNIPVLFPFGHGLSYTRFEYSNLKLSAASITDAETVTAEVTVKNIGCVEGKEAVQLYAAGKGDVNGVIRPAKELKGFAKVSLKPGEEKTVSFTLDKRSFAYYETEISDWYVNGGMYEILIAASSRDIRLSAAVEVTPVKPLKRPLTVNSTVAEFTADPKGAAFVAGLMKDSPIMQMGEDAGMSDMFAAMARELPLRGVGMFTGKHITQKDIEAALK